MDEIISLESIFISILVVLIIILLWDGYLVRKARRHEGEGGSDRADDRYFELKWRINLFISTTTVVAVVLSYLGVSVSNIVGSKIEGIQEKLALLDTSSINLALTNVADLSNITVELDKRVKTQKTEVSSISSDIAKVRATKLFNSDINIVKNINLKVAELSENLNRINPESIPYITNAVDTIYFESLRFVDGTVFPELKQEPLIQIIDNKITPSETRWTTSIDIVTKQYFVVRQQFIPIPGKNYSEKFVARSISIMVFFI